MNDIIESLSGAIDKLYQGFVVRDFLGFVVPGSISLLSLWYILRRPSPEQLLQQVDRLTNANTLQIVAFLGASYLTAWILQCVHYGIIDWLCSVGEPRKRWWQKVLWPVAGVKTYIASAQEILGDGNAAGKPTLSKSHSMITRSALVPDVDLGKVRGADYPPRLARSLAYFERASALTLMTGNIVPAGILLLFALDTGGLPPWGILIGTVILLFVYLEYWRLWHARNLRHRIFTAAAQASDANDVQLSTVHGK